MTHSKTVLHSHRNALVQHSNLSNVTHSIVKLNVLFLYRQETTQHVPFEPEVHKRPSAFSISFSARVRARRFAVDRITRGNTRRTVLEDATLQHTDPACAHGCVKPRYKGS